MVHYHNKRSHQSMNSILNKRLGNINEIDSIQCRERVSGLLKYYYRTAA